MSDDCVLPDAIQTIPAALAFWAERSPAADALGAVDGRRLRYQELHETVATIAERLALHGVLPGHRVVLVLPSGFDMALVMLGTLAVATAAPLHPAATAQELTRDLRRLPAHLLITGGPAQRAHQAIAASLGIPGVTLDGLLAARTPGPRSPHAPRASPPHPDKIATILHTSGTIGPPKRVPRPHRTLLATARIGRDRLGLTRHDVALITHGLHTSSGVANMLTALLNGGACILAPRLDPDRFPCWLDAYRPTWTTLNPAEIDLILRAAEVAGRDSVAGPGSRLRYVRAGGSPMTAKALDRAERSLRAAVLDEYGLTEASCIVVGRPDGKDRRAGSCGRPVPGTVRIVDPAGSDVTTGSSGEIVVHGPTLFPGYLDDPDANAAAFLPGGWFRTGDSGALDGDGYLSLTGRLDEQINRGGEKIAPLEIDRRLLEHPAVSDAATFGVPDPRLGEDIVAAVVPKPGARVTPRELRRWLLDSLSAYKVPRRIWFVTDLPRTETGKPRRGELTRRWLAERQS